LLRRSDGDEMISMRESATGVFIVRERERERSHASPKPPVGMTKE
jgi:hypothetical protein